MHDRYTFTTFGRFGLECHRFIKYRTRTAISQETQHYEARSPQEVVEGHLRGELHQCRPLLPRRHADPISHLQLGLLALFRRSPAPRGLHSEGKVLNEERRLLTSSQDCHQRTGPTRIRRPTAASKSGSSSRAVSAIYNVASSWGQRYLTHMA